MTVKEQFQIPTGLKKWSFSLMGIGIIAVAIGLFTKVLGKDEHEAAIFWGTLLYNSVFFLLIVNASMFFICITTLAMGGWQMAFRRVPEAISAAVPILGIIAILIMFSIVFGHQHHVYHWLDNEAVGKDNILKGKVGFLNPTFFAVWTLLSVGLWALLGFKLRQISRKSDDTPMNVEGGKKFIWKNTLWAAGFIVWFTLTVGSTVPWLWLMSIDAHWYSTMYSWYTFASSFVAGMALITLWVVYLKNKGHLEYVTQEHIHDLGKFMFAFSIFWTYLWFSQFMLIWYAGIPEETIYFKPRVQGPYSAIFFLNLIINFLCPIIILMTRGAKRNYTLLTFMAVLILFGHWLDFYQMAMPGISKDHVTLGWLDFGVLAFFVGLLIFLVGRNLTKAPLLQKNHPFLKESIIHHT